MFELIVNVKLPNIPLLIGVVLPMLLKYNTAELGFWLGSMGNANVWLGLPSLLKFLAELIELQSRVTYLRPRLISTAFKLVRHTFGVTVYDKGKPNSIPNFLGSEFCLNIFYTCYHTRYILALSYYP